MKCLQKLNYFGHSMTIMPRNCKISGLDAHVRGECDVNDSTRRACLHHPPLYDEFLEFVMEVRNEQMPSD
jgi:hypothetical protein